ncbi:transmembrane protein 70 homolog, mitochondrial-like [Clavelina lepadiformis]|uniref:transmembrane protein 70 homolog, mitochondrial-like n=1 Tax=Clavelina lepadiformis TaxID=159417 RepID=UPI0040411DE4
MGALSSSGLYFSRNMKSYGLHTKSSILFPSMKLYITNSTPSVCRINTHTNYKASSFSNYKQSLFNRTDMVIANRFVSTSKVEDPEIGKLLYIGSDKNRLKRTLGSFYVLSAGVAAASPYLLKVASNSVIATSIMGVNIIVFVFLNPLGLYQFGKRYVNELYHNEKTDTYTATTLSPLVVTESRLTFTPKECQMPAVPSVFTSFYVQQRPLFVNSDTMNYADYVKMLRYASDFDYENPDRQKNYTDAIKKAVEDKQREQTPKND